MEIGGQGEWCQALGWEPKNYLGRRGQLEIDQPFQRVKPFSLKFSNVIQLAWIKDALGLPLILIFCWKISPLSKIIFFKTWSYFYDYSNTIHSLKNN